MPSSRRLASLWSLIACTLLAIGVAAPTIYYCQPVAGHMACAFSFNRTSMTDDWRYFVMVWEAARVALVDFHQFPSWNPYHCGGIVLYQDPQAPFPGPLFLLTYFWLPAVAAMKIWMLAHFIAGALGARKIVVDMGGNGPEQFFAAAVVVASGFTLEHTGGGHFSFLPFLLFPWILWAHRRALREPRWAVLVAGLFAVAFYEGATYPIPLMAMGLAFDSLLRSGCREDRRGLIASLPLIAVMFPLLAGARLLPVLAYLHEHPRAMPMDDHMDLAEVFEAWLTRVHARPFPPHVYVWGEYNDYIGLVPVAGMLLGLLTAFARRDDRTRDRRIDALLLCMVVWCALGGFPGPSLYGLIHALPIYASLRVPSRYLAIANLLVAVLAVWTMIAARKSAATARLRPWIQHGIVVAEIVLALFVATDLVATSARLMQQGTDAPLSRGTAQTNFYQSTTRPYWEIPAFPLAGIGTRQCYVPLEWGPAPGLWDGPGPQLRLDPRDAGTVTPTRWTANEVTFRTNLAVPARVLVNQNYETGWRSSVGVIRASRGIIAVDLPAGRHSVVVRHRPAGLVPGFLMLLCGIALAIAVLRFATPVRVASLRSRIARVFVARESA